VLGLVDDVLSSVAGV